MDANHTQPEILIRSRYPDVSLPEENITIMNMLWPQMEKYFEEVSLVCGLTGKEYSYNQVMEHCQKFASALSNLNIDADDFIGIVSPNSTKAIIAFLGIWKAGYAIAPLNHLYTRDEFHRSFESFSIKNVVTTKELLQTVISSGNFKNVIVLDDPELIGGNGVLNFNDMIALSNGNGVNIVTLNGRQNKESIALLSSSTGTTGDSKAVVLTHRSICLCTRAFASPDIANVKMLKEGSDRNVVITVFPLSHLLGTLISLVISLYLGFKIVCLPKFQPHSYHACFRKYKPTWGVLVTPLMKFIIDSPLFEEKDFEELSSIFIGGAPLPKQYIDRLMEKANKDIVLQECYGASETLILTICNPSLKNSKFGSVGRLFPNTIAKVIDPSTGKSLGPNQIGEIRAQASTVMKCYYNDEIGTKEAFDEDNFYCTGDAGYYDEDGCFFIVDRLRDMIKVKGLQVAPKEIETEILNHPKVDNVCVVGVPHDRFGEAPRAYVVRKDDSLTTDEIHSFIKDKLAVFKHLAGGIEFIDAIPNIGIGKPLRRELRKKYLEELQNIAEEDA